ncbi:MAG: hypothetical protein CBC47_07465 [Alphaproteobacteria bacterium TMED87]|nr:hypothetical protein [Rhodospirillaceae bacterium]OUV08451.1 MAG: hypothetical protein CBC47_07465 [Alphaproteobacteria bacterium TMED87]
MSSDSKIVRHKLQDRIFHWVMALCMIMLIFTGISPVIGIEFDWVPIHWISGTIFTILIIWHLIRSIFFQDIFSMWISFSEIRSFIIAIFRNRVLKSGKYSIPQKLLHNTVTVISLVAIITGILLMVRIDTPLWERNPYLFDQSTWGWIYVFHGLSSLCFISIIIIHIYFAIRPEKFFYTRSMVFGSISKKDFDDNHDDKLWVNKEESF